MFPLLCAQSRVLLQGKGGKQHRECHHDCPVVMTFMKAIQHFSRGNLALETTFLPLCCRSGPRGGELGQNGRKEALNGRQNRTVGDVRFKIFSPEDPELVVRPGQFPVSWCISTYRLI